MNKFVRASFLPVAFLALVLVGCESLQPAPVPAATAPAPAPVKEPTKTVGSAAPHVLMSVPVAKDYVVVPVFYGTDRQSASENEQREYGPERGSLVFGVCEVTIPRDHRMGELESPSWIRFEFRADPSKHVILRNVQELDRDAFLTKLRARVDQDPKKEAFVFVHGFNVTFEDAARRTGQMAYDLGFKGAPIFYSWPSKGRPEPLDYTADEASAEWAASDLKTFLSKVAARSGATTIHLIAHSMGTRVLTAALRGVAEAGASAKFNEVILAAPDIDAEVFKRDIVPAITAVAKRVTLYASDKDKALDVSRKVHDFSRAGQAGASIVVVKGVDTVDASAVDTGLIGHSYYGDNRSVLTDIYLLINEGLPPKERNLIPTDMQELQYWSFRL